MTTKTGGLAMMVVLASILTMPTGFAAPSGAADPVLQALPNAPSNGTAPLLMALIEAETACGLPSDYDAEDTEWGNGYNDEGAASFWNGFGVPNLLGYVGDGGHDASVQKCHKSSCTGGYMPVVGDFKWSGWSIIGYGAGITVNSAENKQPIVYSTCAGKALNFVTAQSRASTIDGAFTAHAIHGGILVPESQGQAELGADGVIATGAYSYHWSYTGVGNPISPITDLVPCELIPQVCTGVSPPVVPVYGAGADQDALS